MCALSACMRLYALVLVLADFPLTRRLPPAFSDGVYQPSGGDRPNPFDISDATMDGSEGHTSRRNRTALLTFFGEAAFLLLFATVLKFSSGLSESTQNSSVQ